MLCRGVIAGLGVGGTIKVRLKSAMCSPLPTIHGPVALWNQHPAPDRTVFSAVPRQMEALGGGAGGPLKRKRGIATQAMSSTTTSRHKVRIPGSGLSPLVMFLSGGLRDCGACSLHTQFICGPQSCEVSSLEQPFGIVLALLSQPLCRVACGWMLGSEKNQPARA